MEVKKSIFLTRKNWLIDLLEESFPDLGRIRVLKQNYLGELVGKVDLFPDQEKEWKEKKLETATEIRIFTKNDQVVARIIAERRKIQDDLGTLSDLTIYTPDDYLRKIEGFAKEYENLTGRKVIIYG